MNIETFFDQATFTLTYVVFDEETKDTVIIDPVLDYVPSTSTVLAESIQKVINYIDSKSLNPRMIIETHAHADHITGSQILKKKYPQASTVISAKIKNVQKLFKDYFSLSHMKTDGSQFDLLVNDDESINAGSIEIKVIATPGHTPSCTSYLIKDSLFVGDAIFMPDMGTGRCDFPEGSAAELYYSIHEKIYKLPDETKIYVGHDYQPGGRDLLYQSTVAKQKENNIQLKENTTLEEFVAFRNERDSTLNDPKLLIPSIQMNIRAGKLPQKEADNSYYLKFPIVGHELLS